MPKRSKKSFAATSLLCSECEDHSFQRCPSFADHFRAGTIPKPTARPTRNRFARETSCHLFPTGQGNVIGNPIEPVIKLTANPKTAACMKEHIDVDVSGTALLRGNAACGAANLRTAVRAECAAPGAAAGPTEDVMEVYGNLEPLELDVDFGQEVGPPVHASSPCSAAVQVGPTCFPGPDMHVFVCGRLQ